MNKILTIVLFALFFSVTSHAQMTHSVDGKEVQLTEDITGNASLFHTVIDNQFRYFIKKDDTVTELTNTKDENGTYQAEYKEILSILTADAAMDVSDVNLTLDSLRVFVDQYNKKSDIDYRLQAERPKTKARLGAFAGLSNNPFVTNPDNTFVPVFGAEVEVYDEKRTRHSLALGFKQSLEADDFKYTSSQFGIHYRFRVLNKDAFSIYPQVTFATYTFSSIEYVTFDGVTTATYKSSGSSLDAPLILGLGADIKAGNGYITLSANELAALINFENQGNTPIDIRLGYKLNL
ncbi:MAG: hypothetical protein ACPG45_04600 [Flavobacteriaceae bacterium]